MRRLAALLPFILVAALGAGGCGKHDDKQTNNPGGGTPTGQLRVRLTDAPAHFDSIVLDVRTLGFHRSGDSTVWRSFTPAVHVLDVLTLRNGSFLDLGTFSLPPGTVDSMRIKLGAGSYVVRAGSRHSIAMAAGDTSAGARIPATLTVMGGASTDIGLDFDAVRSLRADGAGAWIFEPHVRALPFTGTGSITGAITPHDSLAAIYVFSGADTVASSLTNANGNFAVTLLPAGIYNLLVYGASNQRDTTVVGVNVTAGQATSLGTIPIFTSAPQAKASRALR